MISEYLNILLHGFVFFAFFAYSLNVVRLLVPPSAHHQTPQQTCDGKFGSFYRLGPLSLIQQNELIFFFESFCIFSKT